MSNTNNIIDINIKGINKKRYRINGDDRLILKLNPTDLNFVARLSDALPKLNSFQTQSEELSNMFNQSSTNSTELNESEITHIGTKLREIDTEMKQIIDDLFDTNVSEICCGNSSMYDPIEGEPRYMVIVNSLMTLYNSNIEAEGKKIQKRMKSHTAKYTNK